jgi:hypothetical protein
MANTMELHDTNDRDVSTKGSPTDNVGGLELTSVPRLSQSLLSHWLRGSCAGYRIHIGQLSVLAVDPRENQEEGYLGHAADEKEVEMAYSGITGPQKEPADWKQIPWEVG